MEPTTLPCHLVLDPAPRQTSPSAGGKALGALGEQLAVEHLQRVHGARVLDRNWRIAEDELRGELDIVVLEVPTATLVVCEVKARRDAHRFGGAVAAISPRKRAQVRRVTAAYLRQVTVPHRRIRLDLIAVDLGAEATLTHHAGVL